jgi:hypothetical protein
MSMLAALVLALLGALGTLWVGWLRREGERDAEALAEHIASLAAETAAQRVAIEATRAELSALRDVADAMRAELSLFVNGPPSLRRPTIHGPQ